MRAREMTTTVTSVVLVVALVAVGAFAEDSDASAGTPPTVDPRRYASCAPREAPKAERCAYVRQNPLCARDENFIPYLETHYCALEGDAFASGAASAALAAAFFGALAVTAERFFVPALKNIASALRLSDDVAGATLLSFGNGAPDIFAQIAALSHRDAGASVALALGAVAGAGMFIASFVFPCVVLFALRDGNRYLALHKWSFTRDVGFFATAFALALGFFVDGSVEAFEAASLFALYLVYLVVLFTGRRVRRLLRKTIEFLKGELDSDDESSIDWDDSDNEDVAAPMLDDANREDEETGGDENRSDDGRDESESDADAETASDTSLEETRSLAHEVARNVVYACKKAEIPLRAMLRLTMPELGHGDGSVPRRHAVALPIAAPLFMLFATGMFPERIRWVGIGYGLGVSVVCAFIVMHAWPHIGDTRSLRALLTACAFFQSILWMNTTASELVSLLGAVGKVSGVSEALLGATVLAWGNSVGDFVSNTVVSREGNPNMAVAACFAGPLMNLLVGTSFGLLLHIAQFGPVTGYVMPNELILLGGALMFALAFALFAIPFAFKWRVSREPAYGMIAFYVTFSVVYALTSTRSIFKKPWLGPS